MKIKIITQVKGDTREIFSRFTRDLFLKLTPPWATVDLKRFDGSRKGDSVQLDVVMLGLIRQRWENYISGHMISENECFFTDEGVIMPPPIRFWRHHHVVRNSGAGCEIVDDIEYKTGFILLDLLMYPVIWIQFAWRKSVYRKVFN